MKFLILSAILASVFIASEAAITRPAEILVKINELEQNIADYQGSVQEKIQKFRASNGEYTDDFYNKTLNIVEENIKSISVSDSGIRETLSAQRQTACIINLANFIDQIIELSGYATSNCIEVKDNNTNSSNDEFRQLLDVFERDVTVLKEIIVNALIGRNIFTEGSQIIERVQEQLKAKTAEFEAVLTALAEQSTGVTNSLDVEIANLKTCFVDIEGSVKSGIVAVEAQIAVCVKFSGRSARSAPILPFKANDFFPKLK